MRVQGIASTTAHVRSMLNSVLAPIGVRPAGPQPVCIPLDRPTTARSYASAPSTSGRCMSFAAQPRQCVRCQAGRTGRKGSSSATKGFGSGRGKQTPGKKSQQLAFDDEAEEQQGDMEVVSKPHYQMYTDAEYAAPRFVGDIEVAQVEGEWRACFDHILFCG